MLKRPIHPRKPHSGKQAHGLTNSWAESTGFFIVVVVFLFSILAVLAILQYHWSGQLSKAEYERMHSSLLASMNQFRIHFNNELQQPGMSLRPEIAILIDHDWDRYAADCTALLDMADYRLIQKVYIWLDGTRQAPALLELNRDKRIFESLSWPPGMLQFKERYEKYFSTAPLPLPPMRPFTAITQDQEVFIILPLALPSRLFDKAAKDTFLGFVLIRLNREMILDDVIPRLAQRYFGSGEDYMYHVAVVDRNDPESFLFRSDARLTSDDFTEPDARLSLSDIPREPPAPPGEPAGSGKPNPADERDFPPQPIPGTRFGTGRLPPPPDDIRGGPRPEGPGREDFSWELLAKHRAGSLEAAVTATRRRNLAISFGSLLLLAASVALVLVSVRRAKRLSQLQIDFVAGVSHELRTPLAVICSAGDNLAEGVVTDSGEAVRNYGKLIRNEGRKLSAMVEQIMQFAGTGTGRRNYSLRPVRVNEIVAAALKQAQPMIAGAGFSVETVLSPDLPPAHTDPSAINQVLQNLIQNAIKYSGEKRLLYIRTGRCRIGRGDGIKLAVEDRGIGIDGKDLPHIFDAFYRGSAAVARQIHGTGLGLFFVQETLASLGGDIQVESAPGSGSVFTIRLPASPDSGETSPDQGRGHSDHAV